MGEQEVMVGAWVVSAAAVGRFYNQWGWFDWLVRWSNRSYLGALVRISGLVFVSMGMALAFTWAPVPGVVRLSVLMIMAALAAWWVVIEPHAR